MADDLWVKVEGPASGIPALGERYVAPSPSKRRVELPLGFEPVLPVGADGLAPRQPAMVGVDRDPLAGRGSALAHPGWRSPG